MASSSFYGGNATPTEYRDIEELISQAQDAANTALTAGQNAEAEADQAEAERLLAEAARDQANIYATNSSNSATNSATSATNAAASAVTATNAANNANTSEVNAATSASNASTSAGAASASATNAAASAAAALVSETAAAASASTASTKASEASASAAAALSSENDAATSATNAATSETNANASASLANDWATKTSSPVAGGEYSAKYHALAAASSATSASSSASAASGSATAAASSATSADTAKTAAEAAQAAAEAVYDNFDDRYLGAKASNPTVDNDGNALLTGALYFNSTAGEMRVYSGTVWNAAYLPASGYVQKSGDTMTGPLVLSGAPTANLEAATKKYVDDADALKANLASPALTGTPTAPTAAVDTNTTQIATTAYVVGQGYVKKSGDTMSGPLTVNGLIESTSGGVKFPDGTTMTTAGVTSFNTRSGAVTLTANDVLGVFSNDMQPTGTSSSASISGNTLTVGGTVTGSFNVGDRIFGGSVLPNTIITALGTGTGGAGTYTINHAQTLSARAMRAVSSLKNTLRFVDTDTAVEQNQPIGAIEWFGNDSSTPGAGVKAYIIVSSESATPDTAMYLGVANNVAGEQARNLITLTSFGNIFLGGPLYAGALDANTYSTGGVSVYPAKAWVNFNGTAAGTWAGGASTVTRIAGSTTATVTTTDPHLLSTGSIVYAASGVVAGAYVVTVLDPWSFEITTAATTALNSVAITFTVNSIRASGNVSSIADIGAGVYGVNFESAMSDENYAAVVTTGQATAAATYATVSGTPTAGSFRIALFNSSAAAADRAYVNAVVMGT